MDASVQSRATTVASAPMSRMSSILDLVAGNSDFFQLLASLTSQAATLIRRISLPRAILDHSSATIEAIHAHQPAKSGGTVSISTPVGRSCRSEFGAETPVPNLSRCRANPTGTTTIRICVSPGPSVCRPGSPPPPRLSKNRLPDRSCPNGSGDGVARLLTFEAH
jgi:hypothetical protein